MPAQTQFDVQMSASEVSWLDFPSVCSLLNNLSNEELEAICCWLLRELRFRDPDEARALLQRLALEEGVFADYMTWRSPM